MPWGLRRFQQSRQLYFLTFSCFHRRPNFASPPSRATFESSLEWVRQQYGLLVYGYVVMLEHVHLLVSEPERDTLARAMFSELAAMNHNCPNWFVSKTVFRRIAGAQEKHDAKHYPESASTNLPICRAMWRGCVPLGISGVWASSARICTIGFRLALCRRLEAKRIRIRCACPRPRQRPGCGIVFGGLPT